MPVPQSDVSPEERAARLLRAERDREMSQPDARPLADPNVLLDCPDRPGDRL